MSHPPELEKQSAVSIYTQLANSFRRQILNGELRPGDRLTTELELAEVYGISRGTVRQAMNLLVSEGLLERVAGKGTFVRQWRQVEPRGGKLGLVVPYARDLLIMDILLGVESVSKSRGYSVLFSFTGEDLLQEARDLQRLREEGVVGVIVFPGSNITSDQTLSDLVRDGFPLVLVDRYLPDLNVDYVVVDNLGGAYRAAEHLIHLGHRAVGFISLTGMQTTSVHDRYLGYRRALTDHGLEFQDSWLCQFSLPTTDIEKEVAGIRAYLRSLDRPTAFITVNDSTALRVLEAASLENIAVPADLALVGFDDIELAAQSSIQLTTIAQPRYEVGMRAANVLIDRFEGKVQRVNRIILPTTLVVRRTCGARLKLNGGQIPG